MTWIRFYRANEGKIVRLVFDEAHQIFTDINYRYQFDKIRRLAGYAVQKIYLTATLPPYLEQIFLRETSLQSSSIFIRAPTYRPNLRYHILPVTEDIKLHIATKLAKHLESEYFQSDSRGIIFCETIAMTKTVAQWFKGCLSHSEMNAQSRLDLQNNWFMPGGSYTWMVATSGFIHGIDHPKVDAVIIIGKSFGLINLVQASGRAGRSNQTAYVFVLNDVHHNVLPPGQYTEDVTCIRASNQWVSTPQCRRRGLTKHMDGEELSCYEIDAAEFCDICVDDTPILSWLQETIAEENAKQNHKKNLKEVAKKNFMKDIDFVIPDDLDDDLLMSMDLETFNSRPSTSTTQLSAVVHRHSLPSVIPNTNSTSHQPVKAQQSKPSISRLVTIPNSAAPSMAVQLDVQLYNQKQLSKQQKATVISAMTSFLYGKCVICWAWKDRLKERTSGHNFFVTCRDAEDGWIKYGTLWLPFKKMLKFRRYKYCWKCGLPQEEFLPRSHPIFKKDIPMVCPFEDFAAVLLWHIRYHPATWESARTAFPELALDIGVEEFSEWVKKETGEDRFYNGLEMIIWFWNTRNV